MVTSARSLHFELYVLYIKCDAILCPQSVLDHYQLLVKGCKQKPTENQHCACRGVVCQAVSSQYEATKACSREGFDPASQTVQVPLSIPFQLCPDHRRTFPRIGTQLTLTRVPCLPLSAHIDDLFTSYAIKPTWTSTISSLSLYSSGVDLSLSFTVPFLPKARLIILNTNRAWPCSSSGVAHFARGQPCSIPSWMSISFSRPHSRQVSTGSERAYSTRYLTLSRWRNAFRS